MLDEEGWEGTRAASECPVEAHCVREDARGERMRCAGQSSQRPPALLGNQQKGAPHYAPGPAESTASPGPWQDRGKAVCWGCPLPRCPSSLPSCPAPGNGLRPEDLGCNPLPRGCHCPLSALSAPIALHCWVFSRTPSYHLLCQGCRCAWLLFPFLVFFFCECGTPTFRPTLNQGGDGESNLL